MPANVRRVRWSGAGIIVVCLALLVIMSAAIYASGGSLVACAAAAVTGLLVSFGATHMVWRWRRKNPFDWDSWDGSEPSPAIVTAGIVLGPVLGLVIMRVLPPAVSSPLMFFVTSLLIGTALYVTAFVPDSAWDSVPEEWARKIHPSAAPSSKAFTVLSLIGMGLIAVLLIFAVVNVWVL